MLNGKVLVLGGNGFVGRDVVRALTEEGLEVVSASRNVNSGSAQTSISLNAERPEEIRKALKDISVVVNCITGSGATIESTCRAITDEAARLPKPPMIVHMSSMSIYGCAEGQTTELSAPCEPLGWYGLAKLCAEQTLGRYAQSTAPSTILRIGCVFGYSSPLWVDRIGLLLRNGRLGDLGVLGDGWSNLVHVNDVSGAVLAAVRAQRPGLSVYNVAAPDSPRWNTYFRDLAVSLDATPLRYKTPLAMKFETLCLAPPAKLLERLSRFAPIPNLSWPSIPPSLLRLWGQQIRLDSSKISAELDLEWTCYKEALDQSATCFKNTYGRA